MSKLFRARALDASKPMPVYMAEELPDLPDYSAINRAVPQMPSGMEKEEECEHHLQRAMSKGLIIPTPEVTSLENDEAYDKIYPADYKLPRQLIHMQPFAMEQDIPDYDMDSEDERWVGAQSRKMDLTPFQFEEMMDRLEKSSGQTVVTLNEAKALLKEDDDLIIAVFDYWLNKRLKTQHPLLLTVKTEHRLGSAVNNPYLAFRRRTEKMQTRKNRKNDETSYEKMLKLRRDLSRAVTLLELVKRREKTKREHLHLTIEVYEKRYQAQDFNGQILSEVSALKTSRPAFAPLFTNQFGVHQNWANKDETIPRKEKRQYKKRKHKSDSRSGLDEGRGGTGSSGGRGSRALLGGLDPLASSDDDSPLPSHSHSQPSLPSDRDEEDATDEGQFAFKRSRHNTYLPPVSDGFGNWPWCDRSEGGLADKRYRFALTSISKPTPRCIGLARRRMGRGGRVILDRCSGSIDDIWSSLDFTIHEPNRELTDPTATATTTTAVKKEVLHFRPKTPPMSTQSGSGESSSDSDSEVESSLLRPDPATPYPFPPEATSICVDVEADRPGDEPPFTTEFNISEYFSPEGLSDFDLAVGGGTLPANDSPSESRTDEQHQQPQLDELGCSRFSLTSESDAILPPIPPRPSQCSASDSVNTNSSSSFSTSPSSSSSSSSSSLSLSSTTSSLSSGLTNSLPSNEQQQQKQQQQQYQHPQLPSSLTRTEVQQLTKFPKHRQLANNGNSAASILSKSLTSPTNNRSGGGGSSSGVKVLGATATGLGNGHQNGPVIVHNSNATNSLQNSHVMANNSSQSTIILQTQQKHQPPSNMLPPGIISQNKLVSLRQQQQQQQSQAQQQQQQIPTSGEITLNSNSEGMDMEVDGVEASPCDGKPPQQQQQLVRTSKTNSLAMEVT
ncbi:enhancer of polycomb homolog 1 isoform X2 [Belonocnema kinseyi]|uniref:enhancer of polycomb homolog 1 isoform X2 n=1 Tax=Belonocnema kinseyi TaxID=2817044 RepID=UPI00143DD01E|nr:enhancer of polycomb homolog 1 isoform X2 [Belonocnema kinseyi]